MMNLNSFDSQEAWVSALVEDFTSHYKKFEGEEYHVCLSGGLTPEPFYRALASEPLQGAQIHLWIGDERFVPKDSHDRNDLMVEFIFGDSTWLHPPIIHAWPHASIRESICARYESEITRFLGSEPSFDALYLGLGVDGHTAGLFKDETVLEENELLAMPSDSAVAPSARMTLTPRVFNAARLVRFLVRGDAKGLVLDRVIAKDPTLPASRIEGPNMVAFYCK